MAIRTTRFRVIMVKVKKKIIFLFFFNLMFDLGNTKITCDMLVWLIND